MDETQNIKTFLLPETKPEKKVKTEKEKKIRVITQNKKWLKQTNIENIMSDSEKQYQIFISKEENLEIYNLMMKEIQQKINGYCSQDVEKKLLNESFVDIEYCIELLRKSGFRCYYCRKFVKVLYKNVREPEQWSLERIDNKHGHIKGNVEIACLSCNLRRRTMYHEKFIFTKQLNITKIE